MVIGERIKELRVQNGMTLDELSKRSEVRDQGVTVLMVEQNAYAALELCERAYVLESGEVALHGPGEDLLNDPHVQRACLGGD